jgi:hypothetical protein
MRKFVTYLTMICVTFLRKHKKASTSLPVRVSSFNGFVVTQNGFNAFVQKFALNRHQCFQFFQNYFERNNQQDRNSPS